MWDILKTPTPPLAGRIQPIGDLRSALCSQVGLRYEFTGDENSHTPRLPSRTHRVQRGFFARNNKRENPRFYNTTTRGDPLSRTGRVQSL